MIRALWTDDTGFVVSAELVLIATVVVIGVLVGLVTIRDQVLQELADTGASIARFNQSYSFSGITGHAASVAGTRFIDRIDFCQGVFGDDLAGEAALCIEMAAPVTGES